MNCPHCASAAADWRKVNSYSLMKCPQCQLIWVPNYTNNHLDAFYGEEYFTGGMRGYENYKLEEENHRRNAREILAQMNPLVNSKRRLLEIGCAYGYLLDVANKQGWNAQGLDRSRHASEYAKNHLGLKVTCDTLQNHPYPDNSFDAILALDVLEHLVDPLRGLEQMSRLLSPNGLLLIITIDTHLFPWMYRLKPPEHLFYFSRKSLREIVQKKGFEILKLQRYWHYYYLYNYLDMAAGLALGGPVRFFRKIKFPALSIKSPTNTSFLLARKRSAL